MGEVITMSYARLSDEEESVECSFYNYKRDGPSCSPK